MWIMHQCVLYKAVYGISEIDSPWTEYILTAFVDVNYFVNKDSYMYFFFFFVNYFFVNFKNFFFVQTIFVDEPISVFSLIYLLVSVMILCRMISLGISPHTYRMYFKLIAWLKYLLSILRFHFHQISFCNLQKLCWHAF